MGRNIDAHVLYGQDLPALEAVPVELPPTPEPLPKGIDEEALKRWKQRVAKRRATELKRTAFDSILYSIEQERKEFQKRQMGYFRRSRSA